MTISTGNGRITNYPTAHELIYTDLTPTSKTDVYKPVLGITKSINYIYGTNYKTIDEDTSSPTTYYRLYDEIYESLVPNLMP